MPRGRPHMQHSASVSMPGGSSVMPATEMSPHGLLIAPASVQLPSVRSVGDLATTSITPAESAISRSMDICSFRGRPTRFGILEITVFTVDSLSPLVSWTLSIVHGGGLGHSRFHGRDSTCSPRLHISCITQTESRRACPQCAAASKMAPMGK